MSSVVPKVAVIGCGISGAVCASTLAKNGVAVTAFDLGRGPGGRMSQRRETTKEGIELFFDHGAPYFTVTNTGVLDVIHEWESRGLVAEWKEKFGTFDCISKSFIDSGEELSSRKYVGIPGMNSICRALCDEPGIESKFGTGVAKMEWAVDQNSWSLISLDGKFLGDFSGLVATDKILASPGFTYVTGHPPPLDMNLAPQMASRLEEVPFRSYFVLMLAFHEPLRSIPVKGLSFINSAILSSAFCDSSKPGHASARGSAFPTISIAREDKCLWDANKRLIVCGDFCVSPDVEGAIRSGLAAASKFMEMCSCTPCL